MEESERKINHTILVILCILMGILTELAFAIPYTIVVQEKYQNLMRGSTSWSVAIVAQICYLLKNSDFQVSLLSAGFAGCYFFFIRSHAWEVSGLNCVFSAIFSIFMMIGKCFKDAGNMNFMLSGIRHFLFALILAMGYFCLCYMFLSVIHYEYKKCMKRNTGKKERCRFLLTTYFDTHPFLISFICYFLFRIPYLFYFYPGVVTYDGFLQLDFYIGSLKWSKIHPAFSTMLTGAIVNIGRFIGGSDNAGIFLYSLFQIVLGSIVVAYSICLLKKWGIALKWRGMVLAYFSLFSIWQIYSVTLIKDVSYYLVTLLWILYLADIVILRTKLSFCKIGGVIITSLLVSFFRNNGIYVVIPTLLGIAFVFNRYRKYFTGSLIVVLFLYYLFNSVLVSVLGITGGNAREMLSIPFQQTARYVKEYPEDVTANEEKIISQVLDYEKLAELYNPDISDPVKSWRSNTKEELKEYIGVWWRQFLRHPICYIESFLNGTYRYFYIDSLPYTNIGVYEMATNYSYVNRGDFDFYFLDSRIDGRNIIQNFHLIEYKLPIINLLYRPAMYTWLLMISIFLVFKQKNYRKLVLFIPALVSLLVNMASPVNGSIRYSLPIMAISPFLFLYALYDCDKKEESESIS